NGAHDNVIGTDSTGGANAVRGNVAAGILLSGTSVEASRGFGGFTDELTLNGSAKISGSRLRLTDNAEAERASAFTSQPIDVTRFNTNFSFQWPTGSLTDGLTFTIQGQAPTALGTQSGIGSEGLERSVSVALGLATTGLFLNGVSPASEGSINLYGSG